LFHFFDEPRGEVGLGPGVYNLVKQNPRPVDPEQHYPPRELRRVHAVMLVFLNPPRQAIYEKINARTEAHFAAGLVEEVKQLRAAGVNDSTNALGSHSYRRVCEYLRGVRTLESAIEQSKQDVRNYAKRQLTWFRREKADLWLEGFGDEEEIFNRSASHIMGMRS
jgi:tRNA dimethylallyltransferase